MKNLSYWAKAHPRQARLYIALIHIILGILGLMLGFVWIADSPLLTQAALYGSVLLFLIAYACYPAGKPSARQYARRKTCEGMAWASTVLFYVVLGQAAAHWGATPERAHGTHITTAAASVSSKPEKEPKMGFFKARKQIKAQVKALREQVRQYKKQGSSDNSIAVVGLALLVLLPLLFLGTGLGCGLSCGGGGAAASTLFAFVLCVALVGVMVFRKRRAPARSRAPVNPPPTSSQSSYRGRTPGR